MLTQPFVRSEREATEDEIRASLLYIFDVVPNNVLYGIGGKFYRYYNLSTNKEGLNIYRSLSPRRSK